MEILQKEHTVTEVIRSRFFEHIDLQGAGFAFPCDKDGNIVLTDSNRENVENCQNGTFDVVDKGIITTEFPCTVPQLGLCTCGQKVSLSSFTNTCQCGRDYNINGHPLAPRSQWGEETGESLSDILAA